MANLIRRALSSPAPVERAALEPFSFLGNQYPTYAYGLATNPRHEGAAGDFLGNVRAAYRDNGVVFACMLARLSLFAEARFQFRRITNGRPGDLFGNRNLSLLERPWVNGTTGDLLSRMIVDADLAGNAFVAARPYRDDPQYLKRMRPDWTTIVMGSPDDPNVGGDDLDAEVIGYIYHPGGVSSGRDPVPLLAEEVAHFAPYPDPEANFRGMSWLSPVLREIGADVAATEHKAAFFRNGATPQLVVSFDKDYPAAAVEAFAARMDATHSGSAHAYRTLYLGGGADVTVAGKDLAQLDFKATQGAGETRIAAAAGMHPAILGLSEGLQGASLNAGNFTAARRLTADKTLRFLWRNVAGSLASLVDVPGNAELWYDDRDIPFLREDQKDASEIQFSRAQTIRELINAGFDPKSVVTAVESDDYGLLVHTGLVSVQLQAPGTVPTDPTPDTTTPAEVP